MISKLMECPIIFCNSKFHLEELKKLKKFVFDKIPYAVVPIEQIDNSQTFCITVSPISSPNIAASPLPPSISHSPSNVSQNSVSDGSLFQFHKSMSLKNLKKRPLFMKGAQNQQGFKKRKIVPSVADSLTVEERSFFSWANILVPESIMIKFFSLLKSKVSMKGFENPNEDFQKFTKFFQNEPFI